MAEVDKHTALQATREHDAAIADSYQPVDGQSNRIKQFAHLTVATFGDGHSVPVIHTLTAAVLDGLERSPVPFDFDTVQKTLLRAFGQPAQNANGVLAFHAETRMHQLVGQRARVRKQQQAFGIDVKAANGLPLALLQARQPAEHRRTMLRVVVGHHFTDRLVICQNPRRRRGNANLDRFACDLDLVSKRDALANVRGLPVDGDAPFQNQLFHVTT